MSDTENILKSSFSCSLCGNKFRRNNNLWRHMRTVHNCVAMERPGENRAKLTCPEGGCFMKFFRDSQLREHLKDSHGINTPVEELNFNCEEEFLSWKYGMQRESYSEYIKDTATKTLASGAKKTYLRCHRSNRRLQKIINRQRALKSQGSNKIGKTCPSKIEVLYNENSTISVKFWRKHCGHTNDLGHVSLDKPTKDQLAKKLQDGVTFEHLLDEVRTKLKDVPKRMMLLKRKDLHNIVRGYNISYSPRRHSEDAISTNNNSEISLTVDQSKDLQNETNQRLGVYQRLHNKASMIVDLLSKANLDSSNSIVIENKLDDMISFLNNVSTDTKPSIKFLTTKTFVNKTIMNENLNIIEGLTNESQEILHVHFENDHSYSRI